MIRRWAVEQPEKGAWVVLWASFILFITLAVSVPLSVRAYLQNATLVEKGEVAFVSGVVTLQETRSTEPVAITGAREVGEGYRILTGLGSRATLTFFDSSTALLYGETVVDVARLRSPRFSLSERADEVRIDLQKGLARLSVAPAGDRSREVVVETPHGEVRLDAGGSYSIQVNGTGTQVIARYGGAVVVGLGEFVPLAQGQRMELSADGVAGDPLPAAQNLVVNGNFRAPLESTWQVTPYADLEEVAPGQAEIIDTGDRRAVSFERMGAEEGVHTSISIEQVVDRDVRDFLSLVIRLDVRLEYQSLPGAGYRSSEFPVMIELKYQDAYGRDLSWYHGFYYRDPSPNWPLKNGEKILPFVWYPFESENLMEALGDARPMVVRSLRIYSSGWNYRAMVSEVGLIAE